MHLRRAPGGTIQLLTLGKTPHLQPASEHDPVSVRIPRGTYRPWRHAPRPISLRQPIGASDRRRAAPADAFFTDIWYGSTLRPMLVSSDPLYKTGSGGETTAASAGRVVLYTGNWFASYSLDYGRPSTWSYLNMYGFDSGAVTACCDQIVRYVPQINRFVWLIQYNIQGDDENRHRLLVASPEQLIQDGPLTQWAAFDITSKSVGRPGQWLDFPELVVGHKDLYLSTNVFKRRRNAQGNISLDAQGNQINDNRGSLMLRLPLSELQHTNGGWRGDIIQASSGIRPAQFDPRQTDNTAYFVSPKTRGTTTVTSLDEGSGTASSYDVDHITISDTRDGGIPWLSRAQKNGGALDTRILGATRTGNQIWTAQNEGTSSSNGLTRPGVHVAVINLDNKSIDTETLLSDGQYAFAFPKLATNDLGQVGATVAYGDQKTGLAVGVMRYQPNVVEVGAFLPVDVGVTAAASGSDYMDVELAYPHTNLFAAAGYTAASDLTVPGSNIGYNPSYTTFGAAGQIPATPPPPTFRNNSSIALTCPAGPLTPGQVVTVTGQLTPPLAQQAIVVSFAGPAASQQSVQTAAGGGFSVSTPPTQTGSWNVTASWAGDTTHLDSSANCSYAVSPTPPPGKTASSISINCPDHVWTNSTIAITGVLNPPDAGVQVGATFTIKADNGSTTTDSDSVASELDGSYRLPYFASIAGYYDIQALWGGDATHDASASAICTVHVIAPPK